MDLIEAILSRRSIRNFKPASGTGRSNNQTNRDKPVGRPSGSNTQPWEFLVLGGKVLEEVKKRLGEAMRPGPGGNLPKDQPDIPYPPMPEPYISRQKAVGKAMQAYLSRGADSAKKSKPDPRTTAEISSAPPTE